MNRSPSKKKVSKSEAKKIEEANKAKNKNVKKAPDNKVPAKVIPPSKTRKVSPPTRVDGVQPAEIITPANGEVLPVKKMERSNSFITRKLSKIYNKLSGSRDSLNKIPDAEVSDEKSGDKYVFKRSFTMSTIPLRKSYRKESKLEQLQEEGVLEKIENVPEQNEADDSEEVILRPATTEPVANHFHRISSPASFRLDRSGSILSRLKRRISRTDKPLQENSQWSTSLQNLQQIDYMVDYKKTDFSFVNYDQLMDYESLLRDRTMSQTAVNGTRRRTSSFRMSENSEPPRTEMSSKFSASTMQLSQPLEELFPTPVVVKRRPKTEKVKFDTNFERNLDSDKNLYRQSMDSAKLRFFTQLSRDSYRWSDSQNRNTAELLLLDNYLEKKDSDANYYNRVSVDLEKCDFNIGCALRNLRRIQSDCGISRRQADDGSNALMVSYHIQSYKVFIDLFFINSLNIQYYILFNCINIIVNT